MTALDEKSKPFRILTLDGGGAKGFYTLGVLREIEGMLRGRPLCEVFDLIFGTSTGAIIAAMLAMGWKVDDIYQMYHDHVPIIMRERDPAGKSAQLEKLAHEVFKDATFSDVKTAIGIVTTKWVIERPMIFKGSVEQAHGRAGTFVPGFGVKVADAVVASCSAYPFFLRKTVVTASGDEVELIDGGYCANNPTLYALADALITLKKQHGDLRVVSLGVGVYPDPKPGFWMSLAKRYVLSVELLQKTMEINTQSMEQLHAILFKDVPTIRINDKFEKPEMATDFLEHDVKKLNILRQRGSESFAAHEAQLHSFLVAS